MKKEFKKGSEEWQMFQDFWKLCQDYAVYEDSEKWLDELYTKCQEFTLKYKSIHLAAKLSIAKYEEMAQMYSARNGLKWQE